MQITRTHPRSDTPAVAGGGDSGAFLRALGSRVREARARLGMTRRALAHVSGVSERYLAQLEAGAGNLSIVLLRQVAAGLDQPVTTLLAEPSPAASDIARVVDLLRAQPPATVAQVRADLQCRLREAGEARRRRVALVGLRGAGKSTLGARLAQRTRAPFVELDREIEREAGTSLSEIFLLYGQEGYRRYERRCLEQAAARQPPLVLATGGSLVSEPSTYDALLADFFTVWLRASPEEHMARVVAQGDMRPMAGSREAMDDLRRILEAREPLYARADLTIDTSGRGVDESLAALETAIAALAPEETEHERA